MALITRETDYAIRMVLCLAREHGAGRLVPVSEIAARMEIPYRFLRGLGSKLASAGLVRSRRGNSGGFELVRTPERISLLDVIRATDASAVTLNACLAATGACPRRRGCTVHPRLARIQQELERSLGGVRFDHLAASAPARAKPGAS